MFKLRNYQAECITSVIEALDVGVRRQLCVLPTGGGKTLVAAFLPKYAKPSKVLFLAHREELLDQAVEKFKAVYPDLQVGKEIGDHRVEEDCNVIVASVPTIGREDSDRLQRIFGDSPENVMVITDEAHHSIASTYTNIYNHFGLLDRETKNIHIGITATPFRGDKSSLSEVFDEITFMKKLGDMILEGWLCDVKSYHIETNTDISDVKSTRGDFQVKALSNAINTPERNQLIIDTYMNLAPGSKALVFCADIAHAKQLDIEFNAAGIHSDIVSGETTKKDRKNIIDSFKAGHTRVITNCSVLTEGFDVPDTETIIIARPTKSPVLYTQMVGRGMRVHESKNHMILIDLYDRIKNPPVHMDRILNIPLSNCTYVEWKAVKEILEEEYPFIAPDAVARVSGAEDVNAVLDNLFTMDILEVLVKIYEQGVDTFITNKTKLSWSKLADGSYYLQCSGIGKLAVRVNAMGQWELWRKDLRKDWNKEFTGEPAECFQEGDKVVEAFNKTKLFLRSASWKNKPASKSQIDFIKKLTGKPLSVSIDTRGKAGHLITSLLESKQNDRHR